MTNKQVEKYREKAPHFQLDVEQAIHNENYIEQLYQWVIANLDSGVPLWSMQQCHQMH